MHSKLYDVPPLDPLLAFEAAARNLSFTKAGEELFITQSAVSRQVQQLEAHLGVKLFERRKRALLLTPPGQNFYRAVKEALQILHDNARKLRGAPAANAVVVTTTPGFASLWLIPRLTSFTAAHPGVDVRISAVNKIVDIERAGMKTQPAAGDCLEKPCFRFVVRNLPRTLPGRWWRPPTWLITCC
jgi:LysR family transcriptional regulator, glycine cleavage system transcriptional activator